MAPSTSTSVSCLPSIPRRTLDLELILQQLNGCSLTDILDFKSGVDRLINHLCNSSKHTTLIKPTVKPKPTSFNKEDRRNNIVIHGLLQNSNSKSNVHDKVTELIKDKLKLNNIVPSKVIPLGKPNQKTPVLVKFQNFNDKLKIFKNCKNLKHSETKYSIVDDLSKEDRLERAKWKFILKTEKL